VVFMVESICGQDFTYTREVEEDRQKKLVKTRAKGYRGQVAAAEQIRSKPKRPDAPFLL
jgi:hypothetical protein